MSIRCRRGYFSNSIDSGGDKMYSTNQICERHPREDTFFCQVTGIPVGTNCRPRPPPPPPPSCWSISIPLTSQTDNLASYLDTIEKDGKHSTKLHEKCDDFDFHILNFPSNIPSGLLMVFTSRSLLNMQAAVHTVMISDIAIQCQLKCSCLRDIDFWEIHSKSFMADIKVSFVK